MHSLMFYLNKTLSLHTIHNSIIHTVVDNSETPDEAAVRECLEETGVKIKLLGEIPNIIGGQTKTLGIQLNTIDPNKREHVDIIYIGKAEEERICFSDREAADCGWFTP